MTTKLTQYQIALLEQALISLYINCNEPVTVQEANKLLRLLNHSQKVTFTMREDMCK